jgi:hypothetical protein
VTDLHQWITQQVERVEALAHKCPPSPWRYDLDEEQVIAADDITVAEVFALSGRQLRATGGHIALHDPDAALRRCEADRRILARHRMDPAMADFRLYATACEGCGTTGDCDDPVTENVSDCPELLDLAHAHGITDDILAALDRPQPPPPRRRTSPQLGLSDILRDPTDVPPALRGPNWKADK